MHYGVDVSSNNAHPINWAALYAYLHGLGGEQPFAIVKVNQGTGYLNPDAQADIAGANAAGFAVGGYLMDEGNADVATEVGEFRQFVGNLAMLDDDELPEGLTTAQYIAHIDALLAAAPAVQYLNQSEVTEGFPHPDGLWLAQYNNTPSTTSVPCLIHQYTSTATVPGCQGNFDLNAWCGTDAQFDAMFSVPTPVPTTEVIPVLTSLQQRSASGQTTALHTLAATGTVVEHRCQFVDNGAGTGWIKLTVGTTASPVVGLASEADSSGNLHCWIQAQADGGVEEWTLPLGKSAWQLVTDPNS